MIARALLAAVIFAAASAPNVAASAPKATPAPKVAPPPPKPAAPKPVAKPAAPKPPPKIAPPPAAKPAAPKPPPKITPPPAAPAASSAPPVSPAPASSSSSEPSLSPISPPTSPPSEPLAPATSAQAEPTAPPIAPPKPAPSAPANVEAPPASLVVDFQRPPNGPAWFVSGLEEVVAREFLRFHAVELAKKIDPALCPNRDPRCLVDQYRAAGVEVLVLGRVEPASALKYQVYETWTGRRAFEGKLNVSGVSMSTLEREMGEIVRPIVQHGGLLDQRPTVTPAPIAIPKSEARTVAPTPRPQRSYLLPLLVAATIVLVASPILLALGLVGSRELFRRETPASWKWSALLLVALSSFASASLLVDLPALLVHVAAKTPPMVGLISPAVAGTLWGAFVLAIGAWVFAPIHGLGQIRHDALWPLLRSWLTLALLRAATLAFLYAPISVLTLRACAELALPERVTWAFVVPLAGLLAHFWLLSLVDNLSVYLDVKLALGLPTSRNPWHATIKRYFRGYIRRNVVDVGDKLLERTLFLPSARRDVISYGGGFARPRILVGEKPCETALGELPDEEEFPERTANPEELAMGIVMPSMSATDPPAAELTRAEQWRHRLTVSPPRPRAFMPRLLGENATLLGWVLPQANVKGIPLISDTEEDFGVVKRLLSEHYSAFEGILHGDEVDDTDPTQKDFLFGALLREMGLIARHDVFLATIGWSLDVATAKKGFFARVLRLPLTLYERLLAAPATKVADAYAALNSGLHHLIQYLCFVQGIGETLVTARANVPRLVETSRVMLAKLEQSEPAGDARDAFRATPRDRVAWLTRIFHGPLAQRRVHWGRVLGSVALAAALAVLFVRAVKESIAYHPMYVERMQSEAAKFTEGDKAR